MGTMTTLDGLPDACSSFVVPMPVLGDLRQ